MKPITRCPICNSKRVERVRGTIYVNTRAGKLAVRNVDFDRCHNCGESFYDFEASKKIDAALAAAKRRKSA